MEKTEIVLNKPFYLRISILELSKIIMYEFWYDYVKPKYDAKAKLCYMDRDDKNMIFIKTLKTLNLDLILQIIN